MRAGGCEGKKGEIKFRRREGEKEVDEVKGHGGNCLVRLGWIGLGWVGLGWVGLGWVGLG